MKKTIFLTVLVTSVTFLLLSFISNNRSTQTRTEEYAIVEVHEVNRKKFIRTTVGEDPAQVIEWEKTKTEIYGDFTPAMKELHKLNEQGFELVNTSTTYTTVYGGSMSSSGTPVYTFTLKKKL